MIRVISVMILCVLGVVLLPGQQVSLVPTKDNTLYEDSTGTLSNGNGDYMFVGRTEGTGGAAIRRAVIMFDISGSVPSGATITAATLQLVRSKGKVGESVVSLHRISQDWGEGASHATTTEEGQGGPAQSGDATWIDRFKGTSQWTTPGGDFDAVATDSISVGGNGTYTWGSQGSLVADVQAWLDDPSANFGWILVGDESREATAKRFDTRENTSESNRPILTITYTTSTSVHESSEVPKTPALLQNYPNPFNPETRVFIRIPAASRVTVKIYSLLGRHIATLTDRRMREGEHQLSFNGEGLPSGIYLYSLELNGRLVQTRRMVLMR